MEQESKPDIRDLNQEELESFFIDRGEPKFRAKQVLEWM